MFLGPRAELLIELLSLVQLSFLVSVSPVHPHTHKFTHTCAYMHTGLHRHCTHVHIILNMCLYRDMRVHTVPMSSSQDCSSVCSDCLSFPRPSPSLPGPLSSCWKLQRQEHCAEDTSFVSSVQIGAEVAWLREAAPACNMAGWSTPS